MPLVGVIGCVTQDVVNGALFPLPPPVAARIVDTIHSRNPSTTELSQTRVRALLVEKKGTLRLLRIPLPRSRIVSNFSSTAGSGGTELFYGSGFLAAGPTT